MKHRQRLPVHRQTDQAGDQTGAWSKSEEREASVHRSADRAKPINRLQRWDIDGAKLAKGHQSRRLPLARRHTKSPLLPTTSQSLQPSHLAKCKTICSQNARQKPPRQKAQANPKMAKNFDTKTRAITAMAKAICWLGQQPCP